MTVEDLYALPDDGCHYELQAGVLISEPVPGWRHGRVAFRVAELLGAHVRRNGLGVVVTNDSGFVLSRSPDTVRGPDVSFVSRARLEGVGDPVTAFPGAPDLAIEVLSPGNTPASLHGKVADYLAAGTRCVWVVDPEAKTVAVYRTLLSPRTLFPGDLLEVQDVLPAFSVDVAELFEG
jgi:Uma2 family endonuclease